MFDEAHNKQSGLRLHLKKFRINTSNCYSNNEFSTFRVGRFCRPKVGLLLLYFFKRD